jgi:energy-coupling factor transporter ATP-binding protein EcfA2
MSTVEELQRKAKNEAMAGSPTDRKRYMENLFIPHRNLGRVMEKTHSLMTTEAGVNVTLVVGPTGAGKSTFGRMRVRSLINHHRIRIQEDPSFIPTVMFQVDAPGRRAEVNFVLFYSRVCAALLSPSALDGFTLPSEQDAPTELLHNAQIMMERAIRERGLEYLVLDEVAHFVNSTTNPVYVGDTIKSFADRSGFNVLMLGAYGCEALVDATDQLSHRIGIVHYERYRDTREDFVEYATFVKSVAAALPYRFDVDVDERVVEDLFTAAFGLPGLTVKVLARAAKVCNEDKRPRWKDSYLFDAMPSEATHNRIVRATLRGERDIEPYLRTGNRANYLSEADGLRELKEADEETGRLNMGRGA